MIQLATRLALGAILAQAAFHCFAQPQYRVTEMGPFTPLAIGQGGMATGSKSSRSYAWDAQHGLTQIPGLYYPSPMFAYDVNARGEVVGMDHQQDVGYGYEERAFVWDRTNGTRVVADFGNYPNGRPIQSRAYGINDLGQIVGSYDKDNGGQYGHGYLYTPGQGWVDLPRRRPEFGIRPEQINNAGQIIGYSAEGQTSGMPIMWQPDGSIVELGHLLNQYQNFLGDINDLGAIAGSTFGSLGAAAYFRSADGTYVRILNPFNDSWYTDAFGMNNLNAVVGRMYDGSDSQGYIWLPNVGALGLNGLLDESSRGWDIISAHGVNDAGQIAAFGLFNGQFRGIVLTPVPEPGTFVGLGLGALGLLSRGGKRSSPFRSSWSLGFEQISFLGDPH